MPNTVFGNYEGSHTRIPDDLARAIVSKSAQELLEREEQRKQHEAEVERLRNAEEQSDGFRFAATADVRDRIAQAFREAMGIGERIAEEKKRAEDAREKFNSGQFTREYSDGVLAESNESIARMRESYSRWAEVQAAALEGDLRKAFAVSLDGIDAGKAAFVSSCELDADELRAMTRDAVANQDGATLRMLEAAAKRSGVEYRNPVRGYIEALVGAYSFGAKYAENVYASDHPEYLANLEEIYRVIDQQLAKAEGVVMAVCA